MLNYDDYVWDKYQIGEWLNVTYPATGKPAVKNLFYRSKGGLKRESASKDPDDPDSIYQDTSMQALQARGVQFLSCHTALEEQARVLIRRDKLAQSPEHIVREMPAHAVPRVQPILKDLCWFAAITRTSTRTVRALPSRSNSRSCKTRRSFG